MSYYPYLELDNETYLGDDIRFPALVRRNDCPAHLSFFRVGVDDRVEFCACASAKSAIIPIPRWTTARER